MTSCIRFSVRSTVDLPQPDGPMKAVTLRGGTDIDDVGHGVKRPVVDVDVLEVKALGHLELTPKPFLGEKNLAMNRAPTLSNAISTMRVNAAPQSRSVGTGLAPAPAEVWSYIMPGSDPMNPLNMSKFIAWAYPTRISSGAVSPMTRARASRMPVTMPDSAVGMTMAEMVFHFGTPSA